MKKRKLLERLLVCIVVLFLWTYRNTIAIRFAPKVVLTQALSEVYSQLENRFSENPLWILLRSLDSQGRYTADFELCVSNEILGSVNYDVSVQTDGQLHQLSVEGSALSKSKNLDFSLYMDREFMALSSADLIPGNFYGITYDTFLDDIRSIPLLDFFVSDTILTQWNDSVQAIRIKMGQDYVIPMIPEITKEDLKFFFVGLMACPCEVEERMVSISQEVLQCDVLSYTVSGKDLSSLVTDIECAEDDKIKADFYLWDGALVKVTITGLLDTNSVQVSVDLGLQPGTDMLQLQILRNNAGISTDYTVCIETSRTEQYYLERWTVGNSNELDQDMIWDIKWNKADGVLDLKRDETRTVTIKIKGEENGCRLETNSVQDLYYVWSKKQQNENNISAPIPGKMQIRKGSSIEVPQYKNINHWSIEDLLILLEGIGTLIGLEMK